MNTTVEHEQIDLKKVLAEIDHLRAETLKMQVETQKASAETLKLGAETQKLGAETKWHPIRFVGGVAISTIILMAAAIGILKAFL